MKTKVKNNQNILDLAIQHGGDISTAFDLARKNNKQIDEWIQPGTEIETTEVANIDVTEVFKQGNSPASSSITPGVVVNPTPPTSDFGSIITLNAAPFFTAPNNQTSNIELVNDDDEEITPNSIVGKKITINSGGTDRIYLRPRPTGQKVIYADYDDAWKVANNADPYTPPISGIPMLTNPSDQTKLIPDNIFNHKFRFTGKTGGYYDNSDSSFKDSSGLLTTKALAFPDNYLIDHSTGLGWYLIEITIADTWDNSLTNISETYTYSGFSNWFMPNLNEFESILNFDEGKPSVYEPFDIDFFVIATSTTYPASTTQYYRYYADGDRSSENKTGSRFKAIMRYHFT